MSYNTSESLIAPYQFETIIDVEDIRQFLQRRWHYCFYISTIYLLVIYFLQKHMSSRSAYDLKHTSAIWNGILAIFSIICVVREIPLLFSQLSHYSFYRVTCDKSLFEKSPQLIFWGTLFLFSKVWELGDTLMIVLKKRNLKFVHWYHHVMTLITLWYGSFREAVHATLFCYANVVVHSFMYSYFAIKCMGIKIPIKIAMTITAVQILQMVFGVFISFWIFWLIGNGYHCDSPTDSVIVIFFTYVSYVILFSYFFYDNYMKASVSHKKIS